MTFVIFTRKTVIKSVVKKCPGRFKGEPTGADGCVSAGGVPPTSRVSQIPDYLSTRPVVLPAPSKGPSGGLDLDQIFF